MKWITTILKILNSKYTPAVVILLLAVGLSYSVREIIKIKKDAKRWENNYNIANNDNQFLELKNGELWHKQEVLKFNVRELKRSNDSVVSIFKKELSDASIRIKNITNILALSQQYSQQLETEVINKDSLIIILQKPIDTVYSLPPLLVGKYTDKFTNAEIYYQNNSWLLSYKTINEIFGTMYYQRDKKKILFFNLRIGKKRYWFDYKESNPSVKTEFELINVERK